MTNAGTLTFQEYKHLKLLPSVRAFIIKTVSQRFQRSRT